MARGFDADERTVAPSVDMGLGGYSGAAGSFLGVVGGERHAASVTATAAGGSVLGENVVFTL